MSKVIKGINIFFKTARCFFTWALVLIVVLTTYFVFDRDIFNPRMKGISPVDINHIMTYLVIPLIILILLFWLIEKGIKALNK